MADVADLLRHAINQTLQLENSIARARTLGYLVGLLIERFAACSPDLLRDPGQERLLWRHLFRRSFCY